MTIDIVRAPGSLGSLRRMAAAQLGPALPPAELVEFDSMINVGPLQNNRSPGVEDASVRRRIVEIVERLVVR